jgi:hypothetical protein
VKNGISSRTFSSRMRDALAWDPVMPSIHGQLRRRSPRRLSG